MDGLHADFYDLELTDLAARIEKRAISPVAVTPELLDRISSLDGTLHSYALVMVDVALAQAEAAEAEIAAGRYCGRRTA
jgi:amidase